MYLTCICFDLFSASFTFKFPGVGGQQRCAARRNALHFFMEILLVWCVSQTEMKASDFTWAVWFLFRDTLSIPIAFLFLLCDVQRWVERLRLKWTLCLLPPAPGGAHSWGQLSIQQRHSWVAAGAPVCTQWRAEQRPTPSGASGWKRVGSEPG